MRDFVRLGGMGSAFRVITVLLLSREALRHETRGSAQEGDFWDPQADSFG